MSLRVAVSFVWLHPLCVYFSSLVVSVMMRTVYASVLRSRTWPLSVAAFPTVALPLASREGNIARRDVMHEEMRVSCLVCEYITICFSRTPTSPVPLCTLVTSRLMSSDPTHVAYSPSSHSCPRDDHSPPCPASVAPESDRIFCSVLPTIPSTVAATHSMNLGHILLLAMRCTV